MIVFQLAVCFVLGLVLGVCVLFGLCLLSVLVLCVGDLLVNGFGPVKRRKRC